MKPKILIINHNDRECGVQQFGHAVYRCLKPSDKYDIIHGVYDNERNVLESVVHHNPTHVIINKHRNTLGFVNDEIIVAIKNLGPKIMLMPHDEIIEFKRELIDHVLWLDPTWEPAKDESVLGRPIIPVPAIKDRVQNTKIVVGYTGFLFRHKRVELLLDIFKGIPCHFNIHFAPYYKARDIAYEQHILRIFNENPDWSQSCSFNHEFLKPDDITLFLSKNTINIFPYDDKIVNLGISAALDYAIAAKRPFMISDCVQFRNVYNIREQISIYRSNPIDVIMNYKEIFAPYWDKWTPEKMQEVLVKTL